MKNLKILLAVLFMALLTACGNTKSTTNEPKATIGEQVPNRGRSNTQATSTTGTVNSTNETSRTRVTRTTTEGSTRTTSSNRTIAANEIAAAQKAKMEKMYADLNMSDDQISRFESEWKTSTGSWSSQPMNNYERTEIQDRIMKDILNDTQFEKYQQWARDNAGSVDGE